MLTVSLKSLAFTACYGLYPQEQLGPNRFEVDISVSLPTSDPALLPFVDYQLLHDAAVFAFDHPPEPQTLEALLTAIYAKLVTALPAAGKVSLAVRKLQPALGKALAWAEVRFERE